MRTSTADGLLDLVLNAAPGVGLALLPGWGPVLALALGGITYVTSSGIIAKLLGDLDWIGNRETPTVLSLLVMEDLAMALYLPILTAVLAGTGLLGGSIALAIAAVTVTVVLFYRWVGLPDHRRRGRHRTLRDEHPLQPAALGLHHSATDRRRLDRRSRPWTVLSGRNSGSPDSDFTNRNTTLMAWYPMHLGWMVKQAGGVPAHGNQRSEWDAGCRFDVESPNTAGVSDSAIQIRDSDPPSAGRRI